MNNVAFALSGAWRVLLASLVLGAGLPVLFTLGIRALSVGAGYGRSAIDSAMGAVGAVGTVVRGPRRPLARIGAVGCFAVVLIAVALGITFIIATGSGKTLNFDHVYPTIVAKH